MNKGPQLVAVEFFRPMAMRARPFCRWHVVNWRPDRLRIIIEDDAEELAHTCEFRAHISARPGADVAVHATQSCVRRSLKGSELRLHRRVAGLAAEGYGLRVFVGAVAAEDGHEDKDEGETQEDEKLATTSRVVQIQFRISCYFRR